MNPEVIRKDVVTAVEWAAAFDITIFAHPVHIPLWQCECEGCRSTIARDTVGDP